MPFVEAGLDLTKCPPYAPLLGFMGAMSALVFTCVGSAYGTGKAAMGISTIGVAKPDVRGPPSSPPQYARRRARTSQGPATGPRTPPADW